MEGSRRGHGSLERDLAIWLDSTHHLAFLSFHPRPLSSSTYMTKAVLLLWRSNSGRLTWFSFVLPHGSCTPLLLLFAHGRLEKRGKSSVIKRMLEDRDA